MADTKDLTIQQGKTFSLVVRWETEPIVFKSITAISLAFGAPRLTVVGHGCTTGWRGAVTRVKGMKQINAENLPPKTGDYYVVTVIDPDTIEFNGVFPADDNGNEWSAYTGGGFFQYNTPVDLTGCVANVKIKDKLGGTVLASNDINDAPKNVISVAIDNAAKTIVLTIPATATDDFTFKNAVYELEMTNQASVVTTLMAGKVSLVREVAV